MTRKKARKFLCVFAALFLLYFATACGKEKSPDYEYEHTSYNLRVEEKDALFVTSLQDVVIYHGEHANYYFDKNLAPELRDAYVTASEQVVQFLVENVGFLGILEIYAADGMYYYNPDSGKCALGAEYVETSVQAALLIQAATGSATANYGLLQAEGFSVAKLLGWDISYVPPIVIANNEDFTYPIVGKRYELITESESRDDYLTNDFSDILAEENKFLLDFEYLCFSENYVEEKQVEYVWKLAESLSGYISENNKEQEVLKLLMECDDFTLFEEKFVALRNAWLENIGSTVRVSAKEYPVHYGNYGRFALFQMETLHGKWYVQGDFDASLELGGECAWIFRENYQDTDAWVQKWENELTYVDGVLRDKTYEYPELSFYFQKADFSRAEAGGYYDAKSQRDIYIKDLYALIHEYCHYLMLQDGLFMEDGVFKEKYITQLHLLPYYYGNDSEITHRQLQKQYKIMKESYENGEDWEKWESYFDKFQEKIGEENSVWNRENTEQFMHFLAALEGMYTPLAKSVTKVGSYNHTVEGEIVLNSFSTYLADTYGEKMLYLIATGDDKVKELTGHTYEEFAEEWEEYLEKSYGLKK